LWARRPSSPRCCDPNPLLTARLEAAHLAGASATAPAQPRSVSTVLARIASIPSALLGLVAMASGHAVMVGVMSMTPVHLRHGAASLQIIGLVISAHIAAMYVASPLVGALSDKLGRHLVILAGATLQLIAVLVAGTAAPHAQAQLAVGLVFLGLGWSCTLIAGSTLLTEAVPEAERPTTQGAADLVMGIRGSDRRGAVRSRGRVGVVWPAQPDRDDRDRAARVPRAA
jgi:MFS family permease